MGEAGPETGARRIAVRSTRRYGLGNLGTIRWLVLVALFGLGACDPNTRASAPGAAAGTLVTGPEARPSSDALVGLHYLPDNSVPWDVPVWIAGTTALVPSENVARVLALSDLQADPTYLIHGAVAVLRKEMPLIMVRPDLASARDDQTEVTFVLDIRAVGPDSGGGVSRAEVTVLAFDKQMQPLSRWSASGSATEAESGATDSFYLASDRALVAFRGKVGEVLHGIGG